MTQWIKLQGLIPYQTAMDLMDKHLFDIIENPLAENTVILLEHEDVYTGGSTHKKEDLLSPGDIPVIISGRGGKFTYHGPGQRVIYPIIDLRAQKDLRQYIRKLQNWIINSLKRLGIEAFIIEEMVGIWVIHPKTQKPAKIGAIGVRVKKWVAYHGIAINIFADLSCFQNIIPCGISDYSVTSLSDIGIHITMDEFDKILKEEFCRVFD